MLKWVLNHEEVTTIIPGITTFDQLDLDWSVASDLSYTEEEQRFLAERDLQGLLQFCQQCRECIPTCPKAVRRSRKHAPLIASTGRGVCRSQ